MRRIMLSALMAIALTAGSITWAAAQESYTYTETRTRTRTLRIDWHPRQTTHRRYTVSVSPLMTFNSGVKFDFERELPRSGHWLGTSLSVYFAPKRGGGSGVYNNQSSFLSSSYDFHRMWGVGTSAIYKYTFGHRGWYFATGLTLDFFRVGVAVDTFVPYQEEGMTFYQHGRALETESYLKPTARFVMGKHLALSRRCYFDLYAGVGLSYSIYDSDEGVYDRDGGYYPDYGYGSGHNFDDVGGFGYRGPTVVTGFRFGVLLWKDLQ